jgi:cysteinyl-tRNA synthetase
MEKYETAKRSILEIRAFYFKWIYKKNIEKKDLDLSVLYDDFNTPASIVLLHKLIKEKRVEELSNLLFILGFAMEPMSSLSLDQIEDLMNEYIGKRRLKDFELSDRVRKTLLDNFIAVEDELWFYV